MAGIHLKQREVTGTVEEAVRQALAADRVVDITTTGKKTGLPRRKEIWVWTLEQGGHVISGRPGRPRDWYANLLANPEFTVHVKRGAQADLRARAVPVPDPVERRLIITEIARRGGNEDELEERVERSPLVRVEFL